MAARATATRSDYDDSSTSADKVNDRGGSADAGSGTITAGSFTDGDTDADRVTVIQVGTGEHDSNAGGNPGHFAAGRTADCDSHLGTGPSRVDSSNRDVKAGGVKSGSGASTLIDPFG